MDSKISKTLFQRGAELLGLGHKQDLITQTIRNITEQVKTRVEETLKKNRQILDEIIDRASDKRAVTELLVIEINLKTLRELLSAQREKLNPRDLELAEEKVEELRNLETPPDGKKVDHELVKKTSTERMQSR
mmetsp:Transcript_10150/g.11067  ORF Transcript_10150/g.11067 Transcript_10150/m.11067 type:complete len:133 (+) Transcript_10150:83-481(+)|eukprot:CAMPEP_0115008940 /NCGR_PEP_ID=MMETSP0216-20121206/22270_1 /TAXON_ID=223996 /ORGANISM="Protocruzia adherens, Strain Boccale" /LENGTH=132 /DNA_ID=CAMNT_0002376561 /DNA_START=84 /DNA_END=482 /DNA_ORIENTATION=+